MSDAIDDGGPAFPQPKDAYAYNEGMSLRDYFAAAVAPGCIAAVLGKTDDNAAEEVYVSATAAYRMADALIAVRQGVKHER